MAPRRQRAASDLPAFDPKPSLEFGARLLESLKTEYALIGKVAMWYWLDNPSDHEYTKDVDFAVPLEATPAIIAKLRAANVSLRMLAIGGVNADIDAQGVRADFIDRGSEEWGDLHSLYRDAIAVANASEERIGAVPVAPPEHLVAMKIAAGTMKDDNDAIRLVAKVGDLDIEKVRALIKRHLGPASIGRLEECLRRAGHPQARRAYTASS